MRCASSLKSSGRSTTARWKRSFGRNARPERSLTSRLPAASSCTISKLDFLYTLIYNNAIDEYQASDEAGHKWSRNPRQGVQHMDWNAVHGWDQGSPGRWSSVDNPLSFQKRLHLLCRKSGGTAETPSFDTRMEFFYFSEKSIESLDDKKS